MWKNRSIQMKFVKDAVTNPEDVEVMTVDPAEIAKIIADHTITITVVIGGVVAANRILKTLCDVAVVAAKAKIK